MVLKNQIYCIMALPNLKVIQALRETEKQIASSGRYEWGIWEVVIVGIWHKI